MRAMKRLGREHPTGEFTFRTSVGLNKTEEIQSALNSWLNLLAYGIFQAPICNTSRLIFPFLGTGVRGSKTLNPRRMWKMLSLPSSLRKCVWHLSNVSEEKGFVFEIEQPSECSPLVSSAHCFRNSSHGHRSCLQTRIYQTHWANTKPHSDCTECPDRLSQSVSSLDYS